MKNIKELLKDKDERYASYDNNAARLDVLFERIEQSECGIDMPINKPWLSRLSAWLLPPARLRYVATAMLAVIIAQAAYIMFQPSLEARYHVASGKTMMPNDNTTTTVRYLLMLNQDATIATFNELLNSSGGQIISGPNSSGAYVVELTQAMTSVTQEQWSESEWVIFFGETE